MRDSGRDATTPRPPERTADGRELAALVRLVADNRDRQAFATLFDHLMPRVKSYAMRLGADGTTAEEVAQEVMLLVWRKADSFDASRATVATWVFTIARNKRIDLLRREKRPLVDLEDPVLVPDQPPPADEAIAQVDAEDRLRVAIRSLPKEQADLLAMAFFEDRSHSAIAAATSLPLGTVKSRIRLALERLRRTIRDE
ncbi:RNA polymerase sigma-70 factor (ECF subfamily) [Stella humosa]|uniref:RNA polymerase sigma-70 factor (ECF subfamily) n=1 Tax=Stella humosa TaxID=94 RepID=A0A3N1LK75_9PROT|nr:sigma-70 family RNA polymerase sigma factor [Stella humosa]ROP91139.1 RNA polymerase sigma-70 factor (ECF subfamily) [Stella humosa]